APSRATCSRFASRAPLSASSVSCSSSGLSSTRRISAISISSSGLFMSVSFEREVECGSFADLRFSPDAASVAVNDALDEGEPDSGSLVLGLAVQSLKHAEELVRVPHVESDSVVPHVVNGLAVLLVRAHLDASSLASSAELDCVGEKVGVDLLQEAGVRAARG